MMRKLAIVLSLPCLLATSSVGAGEREKTLQREIVRFPKVEMGKDADGFAKFHLIDPPAAPLKIGDRYYHGFRFTTPAWLDGKMAWFMLQPEPPGAGIGAIQWFITPVEGEARFSLSFAEYATRPFPLLTERFPKSDKFLIQHFPLDSLDPGREYLIWYNFTTPRIPLIAATLTVQSERGMAEFGGLPTGDPDPTMKRIKPVPGVPVPDRNKIVAEMAATFRGSGSEAALRQLDEETTAYVNAGGRYRELFIAIWREAQLHSGREHPDWAGEIWDWMFSRSIAMGETVRAREVITNAMNGMSTTHRFGRRKELLEWLEQAIWRSGYSLDPASYPDLGPGFITLPEIRHRNIPMLPPFGTPRIKANGEFEMIKEFTRFDAGSFLAMADDREAGGRWREALEWRLWVQDWATQSQEKHPDDETTNVWFKSALGNAINLVSIGLPEVARGEFRRIAEKEWPDAYQDRSKINARIGVIRCALDLGEFEPAFVTDSRDLWQRAKNTRTMTRGSWHAAALVHARAVIAGGDHETGLRLLEEQITDGSEAARFERCLLQLSDGKLEGVEDELLLLLESYRTTGRKLWEGELYSLYAAFLEVSGRHAEALAMRREAIRLMRGFDLIALLPPELARLAVLLAKCGDFPGSDAAAAEATRLAGDQKLLPARIRGEVERLLAGIEKKAPAPEAGETSVAADLQPVRALILPIEGRPLRGRLTLSNPAAHAIEGTLAFDGIPADAVRDPATGNTRVTLGSNGMDRLPKFRVDPGSFTLIDLAAAPGDIGEGSLTVVWSAPGQKDQQSVWTVHGAEKGVAAAVIDVGEFKRNAFYSVPIHHHYFHPASDSPHLDLRINTSAPARVELYDASDRLVMVDSQGNGSLRDKGDLLFIDANSDGEGDVATTEGEAVFRLQVYPAGEIPADGMEVSLMAKIGGEWVPAAEDRIQP